ncbi:uncharacterized protein BDCG_05461 [Blastomyces dermatitidis ER-3]|uniref:Zn(2)-C6 fungal-type domain-containing protein n=2 Tax=Blastomyces TaxID=229219 RepID=A0A179URD7_BLAGS|nr:uncharacterized protein BDBG_06005 [Blastomyces gilchristii SLH14081]XP_045277093.1 uncharacterized protein BDCG_05461 [Blastomyces dermatitidis ER-3]EEQ90341.1 hypothetical protein BDCG_05461 [Blastomyces dermatitidis ER-3]EQL29033.1 hypothetical protein BDFG_08295 [Blastomyces dermatitidis ATCC 26199]OAT10353.1 hypothetical protein BDBG_06005 [Blastomyces gilchristii SLH14081]
MGRKPNGIVTEFFNRGAKLPDSSNRYEHTCKSCGQNFPKGRADSLLSHLVKTCQAISAADKQRVLHLWRAAPERGGRGSAGKKLHVDGSVRIGRGKPGSLPYAARQTVFNGIGGLNGLNVLAEASRQVGASDGKHPNNNNEVGGENPLGDKTIVVDPALETSSAGKQRNIEADLRAALAASSPPPNHYDHHSAESSTAMAFLNNNFSLAAEHNPDPGQSSQLSLIAASANEMVPQDGGLSLDNDVDFDSATHHAAFYPRPIAIHPSPQDSSGFINNFGEASKPTKHKLRAQFSEERRKEVQLVRKMGACLRCRMLKKTCSSEDPCRQCRTIQNPRVWMECCIRDRLPTQLTAYSAGLHTTLAYHDITNAKNQLPFDLGIGRIEIFHFDCQPPKFITFSALHHQTETLPNVDPELPTPASDEEPKVQAQQDIRILEGDIDELFTKVETYVKTMATQYFESEPSTFVRESVTLAWELYQNTADQLLAGVLDLWIATRILVDADQLKWKIFLNPTLPPSSTQPLSSTSTELCTPIDETNSPHSYALICAQLRAATERFAGRISKTVLTKIEQRLLQKQRSGHFRTFLGAVVLMNCVERMSWLFMKWENSEQDRPQWPLENGPAMYADQNNRFADIVTTHLRMRSLAPDCTVDPETGNLMASYSRDPDVTRWFNAIGISPQYFQERQMAAFDASNPRSLDLLYCTHLFRPAAENTTG